jgi:hypothetical protein
MSKFIEGLLIGLGAVLLIGAVALLSGTIIFLIWPVAIPAVFPGLVTSGVIAAKIAWWPAVCFTWICGILIKSSQTNNNK